VLIDAGRSCKQLEQALELNDIDVSTIGGIFITHEHIDHCSGLKVFAKRYGIKVYASEGTLLAMEDKNYIDGKVLTEVITDSVAVGNMQINRSDTPHDARESCCYQVITGDDRRAVVATDIGKMTDEIRKVIVNSDLAVVESNHDINMLKRGPYPYNIKQRILSDVGHLSNEACAMELADFVRNNTVRLLLGHISENNNLPTLALNTSLEALAKQGMKYNIDFTLETVPPETLGKAVIF